MPFCTRKTISLVPLDEMFLHEPDISEMEYVREYHLHEKERLSFDLFKEIYSLEMIHSLKYLALKDEYACENHFNKKDFQKEISSNADVYISIADHENMTIVVQDNDMLLQIINQTRPFCEHK